MAESVVNYHYNGVEYTFVSKDPAQIDDLKCPICLELVYDPVQTKCGHLFCMRCVSGQAKCPTCRAQLDFMLDQFNGRKVKGLRVQCPNSVKGCTWQGDLADATRHTSGTDCPMRRSITFICQFCRREHAAHLRYTACGSFPLPCPAGCGKSGIQRDKMAAHLALCAEELIPCSYASIGCSDAVRRKQLQAHLEAKKDRHLKMSTDMAVEQGVALSKLCTMVQSMTVREQQPDPISLPTPLCSWLQNAPTCYARPPCVFQMKGFQEGDDRIWPSSAPFYSHFGGYKACLKVFGNGIGIGKGTHVSAFIYLMRGDNDDNLTWPFNGTIRVSLLNQLENGQHCTREMWSPDVDLPEHTSGRVTKGVRADFGNGQHRFISHQELRSPCNKNQQFLKDNTLFFRVDCFEPKLV